MIKLRRVFLLYVFLITAAHLANSVTSAEEGLKIIGCGLETSLHNNNFTFGRFIDIYTQGGFVSPQGANHLGFIEDAEKGEITSVEGIVQYVVILLERETPEDVILDYIQTHMPTTYAGEDHGIWSTSRFTKEVVYAAGLSAQARLNIGWFEDPMVLDVLGESFDNIQDQRSKDLILLLDGVNASCVADYQRSEDNYLRMSDGPARTFMAVISRYNAGQYQDARMFFNYLSSTDPRMIPGDILLDIITADTDISVALVTTDTMLEVTSDSSANLRASTSTDASILAIIPRGSIVYGIAVGDWWEVTYEGFVGYLHNSTVGVR